MLTKLLIAGPCVGEHSEQWIVDQAGAIYDVLVAKSPRNLDNIDYNWIFKCSFDKANRTDIVSYRGLGLDATLRAFAHIKELYGCRVTTDIHEVWQAHEVGAVVDVIQIPAMLSRQTDLITAATRTGKAVNIKVGTNMKLEAAGYAAEKARSLCLTANVWLTYRGTAFGDALVFDPDRLWRLGSYAPTIADVTHSAADRRGSQLVNARVAAALGVDGLFMECHPKPSEALSDSSTQLAISRLGELLENLNWARQ